MKEPAWMVLTVIAVIVQVDLRAQLVEKVLLVSVTTRHSLHLFIKKLKVFGK